VACAERKHSGLTDILELVGKASGIDWGGSLLSDKENQGNARRAWKEPKRKDLYGCQARKSTGQVA
jgi:hypothetical protein